MSVRLGSNVASLNVQRRLFDSSRALSKSFTRLASGLRINSASDDASGLAISSGLNTDARVFAQGVRNVNDGISLLNIAEGALQELSAVTIRQRELATQSANGVLTLAQRRSIHREADALVEEFNRIVNSVDFNKLKLYDGSFDQLRIQGGYGVDGGINFDLGDGLSRLAGDGGFQTAVGLGAIADAGAPDVGDVNGDGILDVVTIQNAASTYSVILGVGDGTFLAARSYALGMAPRDSVMTDMNGDGILDLVVGGFVAGPNELRGAIMLGNGNGTFRATLTTTLFGTSGTASSIVVADFNGDGKQDIAAMVNATNPGNGIVVQLGLGDGRFGPTSQFISEAASSTPLLGGDFNGDGVTDLAYGTSAGNISILLGNGTGTFKAKTNIAIAGAAFDLSLGDLNNDGLIDIVTSNSANGTINVLRSNGNGSFNVTTLSTGFTAPRVIVADFSGDGYADVQVFSSTLQNYFQGNGDGTFQPLIQRTLSFSQSGLPVAFDMNGDGARDLIDQNYVHIATTREVLTEEHINLNTQQFARDAMRVLDDTLRRINSELGGIGSLQSRLSVATTNLFTAQENFLAARSRITDADIAEESAHLVKNRILQQAGAALLAQANQAPALALDLLS